MQYYGKNHQSLAQAIFKEDLPKVIGTQEWVIVDIRMPLDFMDGHLKGAVNITTQEELQTLLNNNADKKILLNCYSGHTVSLLGSDLVNSGYTNVYFLDEEISRCL
ncbi:rhodanese-like domain-containing protein [Helicobacter turcicus]|uniref:Rhodanese-like domain-containing protein n=1 Tax=Helicobacter turcicus TaxID=2867412 RepID=A0ABS7JNU5_9HELI|nr:rhodanese-like domain-containing protein [Helicobacter turcicus]MBX7491048.1 rhodanese-like domain-containing protein [Helicobacter turcicus]MBX7546309.1 rhodanese-like domain-containing protein [Helicobacter turcicus]